MECGRNRTLYLVFSNPLEGRDEEFNEWYDKVHLPQILATPGMLTAQRFDLRETQMSHHSGLPVPTHRYLIVYEMEGDVEKIMGQIQEASLSGEIGLHEALDLPSVRMSFWSPHGPQFLHGAGQK